MKRLFTLTAVLGLAAMAYAQSLVTIPQINQPVDLGNCDDTPVLFEDTVTFVGYVVTSGNLGEVKSSSTQGAGGIRPFIWMNDTANGGEIGPNTGLEVMGVNWETTQATQGFIALQEGDIVEVTGVVGYFDGATQFQPLNNNSLNIIDVYADPIVPVNISIGDLNDENQENILSTGEQYQGAFIEVNDVVVTSVNPFGSGADARVSFTVSDADGNQMEVSDFFLAQRLTSWSTLNLNSPASTGSFVPPSVGTFYTSLKGVVEHSGNGCLGDGFGYRIHPFDSTHYEIGATAPAITNAQVDPTVPTSSEVINISANVEDFDGTLTSVELYYSSDPSDQPSDFTPNAMTLISGVTYEFDIPAQADGSNIRYYIKAVDNDTLESYYPIKPASQEEPNTNVIAVRDQGLSIMEVQTPTGSGDASPFEGQTVTVGGYVTASARSSCALGYVYIQDSSATEYAGIQIKGSADIYDLYRNQYVEVTGTVVENFGFTYLDIESMEATEESYAIAPVVLDPSDTTADMEKYESVLVTYENPEEGGKLYITVADAGFGEYQISTNITNKDDDNSRRVLAGRQREGQGESSLYVQLVTDEDYATLDGEMAYEPIVTDTTMTMDRITGPIYYAFGTYKITPRTNHDIEGLSVELDTTCFVEYISIEEGMISNANLKVYPNPASDVITIEHDMKDVKATIYNINGQLLQVKEAKEGERVEMNVATLGRGVYILQISRVDGTGAQTKKLLIN